jgi:6-phosphofructokinase 1
MRHGIRGLLDLDLVDLAQESEETLSLLRHTPGAALGTIRYKLQHMDYGRVLSVLRAHNVRFFCYIGGNDSMDTAHRVHLAAQEEGYTLQVIGVPKTVDNDLAQTDHCPGYGSAARFVALAVRDSGWDTRSMQHSSPVKIVELMGRNAGWLAAATALGRDQPGDPPHLIYVPERPVREEEMSEAVKCFLRERGYCVIALSEGAVPNTGIDQVDSFGHKMKGGAGEHLARVIVNRLGAVVRLDKPNYLQRSFSRCISATDAEEAHRAGRAAVRLALEGHSDVMVTLVRRPGTEYHCDTGSAPLAEVANLERLLPDQYINREGNDVTSSFLQYARPLIGEPLHRLGRLQAYRISSVPEGERQ